MDAATRLERLNHRYDEALAALAALERHVQQALASLGLTPMPQDAAAGMTPPAAS